MAKVFGCVEFEVDGILRRVGGLSYAYINMSWWDEKRYDTFGRLYLVPTGYSHTATFTITLTPDMVATENKLDADPVSARTNLSLSYIRDRKNAGHANDAW